jgi:hypothetical protein
MSSGGGAIWTIVAATAAGIATQAARAAALDQELADTSSSSGPYRPAAWQGAPLVTITVPGSAPTNNASVGQVGGSDSQLPTDTTPVDGGNAVAGGFTLAVNAGTHPGTPDTILVFDAVIRTEHQQRIEKTQHPIQTGANISDHAFIQPARVVLEIGMSDAMDSFTPGQWTGNASKSVNTYQTLKALAATRQAVTVTTRLNTYTNMLLTDISAPDTVETRFALRATVVLEELLTGTITSQQVSARPDLTGATSLGAKSALPVPASILQQNVVNQTTTVPNAGRFSSNPVTNASGNGV